MKLTMNTALKMITILSIAFTAAACKETKVETDPVTVHILLPEPNINTNPASATIDKLYSDTAESFHKLNPNIKVTIDRIPATQFTTEETIKRLTSNVAPDIMPLDVSALKLVAEQDALLDLRALHRAAGTKEIDIDKVILDSVTINGEMLALPNSIYPYAVLYNKQFFDKNQVPYPQSNWTWEQFRDISRKITPANALTPINGSVLPYMPFIFDSLLASSGTRLLSPSGDTSVGYLDSPEAVRTLRWLNDYYRDDETKTAPMSFTDAGIHFNNNRAGMIISDLNGYKFYKTRLGDHLGVAPLPRFENGKRVNAIAFGGFGIARNSKNPQAAWKFLEYLTLTENEKAVEFADHYLTTSKSMSEAFHQDTDPVKSIFEKEIDYAVKPLEYHNPFLTLAWNRELLTEFQSLLIVDHADIPEKLHQLALKLDKELQRSRSEHDRQITNP